MDFAAQVTITTDTTGDTIFYLMNETLNTVVAKSVTAGLDNDEKSSLSLLYKGVAAGNTTFGLYIISLDDGSAAGSPDTASMELQYGYKVYDSAYPLQNTFPASCGTLPTAP